MKTANHTINTLTTNLVHEILDSANICYRLYNCRVKELAEVMNKTFKPEYRKTIFIEYIKVFADFHQSLSVLGHAGVETNYYLKDIDNYFQIIQLAQNSYQNLANVTKETQLNSSHFSIVNGTDVETSYATLERSMKLVEIFNQDFNRPFQKHEALREIESNAEDFCLAAKGVVDRIYDAKGATSECPDEITGILRVKESLAGADQNDMNIAFCKMYVNQFNAPEEDMSEICQSWQDRDCSQFNEIETPNNFHEVCAPLAKGTEIHDDL